MLRLFVLTIQTHLIPSYKHTAAPHTTPNVSPAPPTSLCTYFLCLNGGESGIRQKKWSTHSWQSEESVCHFHFLLGNLRHTGGFKLLWNRRLPQSPTCHQKNPPQLNNTTVINLSNNAGNLFYCEVNWNSWMAKYVFTHTEFAFCFLVHVRTHAE